MVGTTIDCTFAFCLLPFDLRLASALVELEVPVQVVAPGLRRVAQPDRDPDGRSGVRTPRRTQQLHARFRRRTAALLPVARDAAGDDVLPVLAAALCNWHHMVERQLA